MVYDGSGWNLNSFSSNTKNSIFTFECVEKIGKIEAGATITVSNAEELEDSEGNINVIERPISISLNDISVTPSKVEYYRNFFSSQNKFAILEEDVVEIERSIVYHEINIVSSMIFNSNDVARITLSAEKKSNTPSKYIDYISVT